MSTGWWELIFLMVLMKLPIVYLAAVVWWAVRAEPRPEEGAAITVAAGPRAPSPERSYDPRPFRGRVPRQPRPHGGPARRPARVTAATPRAERQ